MLYVAFSVILGLAAWIIAVIGIVKKSSENKYLCLASLSACLLSLYCQLLLLNSYAHDERQWGAIIDALGALSFVAPILIAVTVILNLIGVKRAAKR